MAGALDLAKPKGKKANDVEARRPKWLLKLSLVVGSCLFLKNSKEDDDGSAAESDYSTKKSDPGAAAPSPLSHFEEIKFASNLRRFSFDELKEITHNFKPSSILGQGGFGCVFKGMIKQARSTGSSIPAAVKILNIAGLQGHKEWLTEINYLGALQHPNLVKLIGYCIEEEKRVLVYEFMPRGSLDNHLFRRTTPLPWRMRLKIVIGAAKGLAFLHEEADRTVIFRDFKTSNILMDAEYNAKLSDFGLAKDGPEGDSTHVSTRVMGTFGYAAPEYVMTGHLTVKSDVYSFGVVLLELLTGRKAMDKNRPRGEHNLVEWARHSFEDRWRSYSYKLIDPRLQGYFSMKASQTAFQLAARCLSRQPKSRPTMSEVVHILEPLPELNDLYIFSSSFKSMPPHGPSHPGSSSSRSLPNSPFRPHYPLPFPSPKGIVP